MQAIDPAGGSVHEFRGLSLAAHADNTEAAATPPPFLDFDPDGGTFGARPELFAETFAQDCPPDIARDAAALLVRQTLAVTQQPVLATAWHDLPTTYVVCTEDQGTSAAAQREYSRRATTSSR